MRRTVLLVTCVALLVTACGGGSRTTTYSDPNAPVTFAYPSDFTNGFADTGSEFAGRPPTFRTAVGVNSSNVVVISTYTIKKAYESYGGVTAFQPIVDSAARAIARAAKTQVTKIGHEKLGPLDGYTYDLDPGDGSGDGERLIFAFRGTTEYFERCTWFAAQAEAVKKACQQVQATLKLKQ